MQEPPGAALVAPPRHRTSYFWQFSHNNCQLARGVQTALLLPRVSLLRRDTRSLLEKVKIKKNPNPKPVSACLQSAQKLVLRSVLPALDLGGGEFPPRLGNLANSMHRTGLGVLGARGKSRLHFGAVGFSSSFLSGIHPQAKGWSPPDVAAALAQAKQFSLAAF